MPGLIIFRCPNSGFNVQTHLSYEEQTAQSTKAYEAFSCPACTRTHLIDTRTGKVVGQPG